MSNDQELVRKLRQKFGRIRTSQGKNGKEYIVDCLACGGKSKCYVNPKLGVYVCFKCGDTGPISSLVDFTSESGGAHVYKPQELPSDINLPGLVSRIVHLEDDHPASMYLKQRNCDKKELDEVYGVRYCYEGRSYSRGLFNTTNTLVFPIWQDGKLVGWQARLLYNPDDMTEAEMQVMGFIQDEDGDFVKPPKYWTNPGLPKGRVFFNHDWAKQTQVVVVTEGVFDAIAVGRSGVATLGKGVTPAQVNRLKAWPLVVLLLDPGSADKEMIELTYSLGRDTRVLPVVLQGYKDAGEAPRYEIWEQIADHAISANIDLNHYHILV
jgi:hypothetical protein